MGTFISKRLPAIRDRHIHHFTTPYPSLHDRKVMKAAARADDDGHARRRVGAIEEMDRQSRFADIKDRVRMVDVVVTFGFAPGPVFGILCCARVSGDNFLLSPQGECDQKKEQVWKNLVHTSDV